MADNLIADGIGTGKTGVVAVRLNREGEWWNTSAPAFESYNAANIAVYAIAMNEVGTTGSYTAADPAVNVPGSYRVIEKAGADLTQADVALRTLGSGYAGPWHRLLVNDDKSGYALTQAFPTNFADLGINSSGHIERVVLVDTTTANTDMRGTDSALTTLGANAPAGWIDAASVASAALNDKGNWNVGKTGYTLTATTGLGNQTASITGNITGNLSGSVGSVTDPVTVGTNNDKTGYALTQTFPTNFADLGINSSGHISRVTLVDTTTANTDMRGTDNALLAASYTAPANSDITAIKAKTDNLPASPAAQSKLDDVESRLTATRAGYLDNLNVTGTLANTDNANTFKADVSGLSTFNAASDQVTVGTNNDKTGYTLTQTFPTNFADLAVNGSGHVVLQDSSLTTAKLGTFELAKGTNLTGLNDIAATAVVSDGAITTSGGAVSNVTTVATTTNLTNLPTIPNNWITAAGINNGALTAAKFASGAFDAVWTVGTRTLSSFGALVADTVAAVWNRVLSKANHNTARSAGRMIRNIWQSQTLQDGEAQGGTSNTITLASTATTVCLFQAIVVENSSGVRQCRFIVDFDNSTKVATVGTPWCVTPEAGDDYLIVPLRDMLANVPNGFYPAGSIAERIVNTDTATQAIQQQTDQFVFEDDRVNANAELSLSTEDIEQIASGVVDGIGDEGISISEQALIDITNAVAAVRANVSKSPNRGGLLRLFIGDTYAQAIGTEIRWILDDAEGLADLSSYTPVLSVTVRGVTLNSSVGVVSVATGNQRSGYVEVYPEDFGEIGAGNGEYAIAFVVAGTPEIVTTQIEGLVVMRVRP